LDVTGRSWSGEILYQIFPRSFYDTNGDAIGDLRGIAEKLDYLRDLGVTALWINPIFDSRAYHNYFADSFDSVDTELGSIRDFRALAQAAHKRGMKLLLDMETQYVTDQHRWFLDCFGDPVSDSLVWYNDSAHRMPEPGPFGLDYLSSYDGTRIRLISLDLATNPQVEAQKKVYRYWLDPDGDGVTDDGVDGFRIDHIMDDLDWKQKKTGLLKGFWHPLFASLREVKPTCYVLCEQSDWGFGHEMFESADADAVFALPLMIAIRSLDRDSIAAIVGSTLAHTPPGRDQVTIIENHDFDRFASAVRSDPALLRMGTVLHLTLPGIPCLYYGQEIGMRGMQGDWGSDGNDIPRREAFEWYADSKGKGMATWYAGTGPWWDQSELRSQDGISLEEQLRDSSSLWYFYRKLIRLRKSSAALSAGEFIPLQNTGATTLTFARRSGDERDAERILVIINLGSSEESVDIDLQPVTERSDQHTFRDNPENISFDAARGTSSLAVPAASALLLRLEE
jgi:glycosidase